MTNISNFKRLSLAAAIVVSAFGSISVPSGAVYGKCSQTAQVSSKNRPKLALIDLLSTKMAAVSAAIFLSQRADLDLVRGVFCWRLRNRLATSPTTTSPTAAAVAG
ncbi:MAG: hypothetical protein EOQ90_01365 [Mesorhizobium sp.]|nr:MAG: hypothetical protein EOQ90_01365 [Mesorhizobium sp.]RWM86240.1 MAG: hypothetical protein EOR83_07940 [Mesorhizobium sp.]